MRRHNNSIAHLYNAFKARLTKMKAFAEEMEAA